MTLQRPALTLGLAALGALAASAAQAAITPTLVAVTPHGDGTFTFTYEVALAADQDALPAGAPPAVPITPAAEGNPTTAFQDYFTLYDFSGFVPGSQTQPAGWAAGSLWLGPTPSTTAPADDPTSMNLFWYRTGEPVLGPADLGTFSARSTTPLVVPENYTSDATRSEGPAAGTAVGSIGTALVPQVTGGCQFGGSCGGVTEPGTAVMLVIGLLGAGLYYRRAP